MPTRHYPLLIAALLCSTASCKKADPLFCDENTPCEDPARPFCDLEGEYEASEGVRKTCIPYPWDASVPDSGTSVDATADASLDAAQPDAGPPPTVLMAVGNYGEPNRVYRATATGFELIWSSDETDNTRSIALGDYDGDGDLDLAVGNQSQPYRVYRNDGTTFTLVWSSTETDGGRAVAWGDFDKDGDLDLATATRLYRNIGEDFTSIQVLVEGTSGAKGLAWADFDDDGDLDLALTGPQFVTVMENTGASLFQLWKDSNNYVPGADIAWGDVDGDGSLELAVAFDSFEKPNRIYKQDGEDYFIVYEFTDYGTWTGVDVGDYDGDGSLDIAFSDGYNAPDRVYRNTGNGFSLHWSTPEVDSSTGGLKWIDFDGDGNLDLVTGTRGKNRLYENEAGSLSLLWSSIEEDDTQAMDVGSD